MVRGTKWLICLLPGLTGVVEALADTPCMQLAGVVQDYTSRQPLSARLYVKTPAGRESIGNTLPKTGRFGASVGCSATVLVVECTGYRSQQLYLNLSALPTGVGVVEVVIPLVAVDPQGKDKPYLQTEQTHFEQSRAETTTTRPQHNVFVVSDALTGKQLPAQTCFFFTNSGQKRCIEANADGQLSIDFDRKDIVAMEVTAPGYQTYEGNLIVDELDGRQLRHSIRLTRELTLLSVRLNELAGSCELRTPNRNESVQLLPVGGQTSVRVATNLIPQPYELVVLDPKGTIRERQSIVLRRGLNVVRMAARPPVPSPPVVAPPVKPLANVDSLPMLYFEQGSFVMPAATKTLLLQTADYLRQHPELRLRLAGHTDREGNEQLNRSLSENRARVASNFLLVQGIPESRLEVVGHGSRYPVAPSDSEENKAKNRRVQLLFIPNLSEKR